MQNISKMQCDELNCQLITTRHMTLFRPHKPAIIIQHCYGLLPAETADHDTKGRRQDDNRKE